MKIKKVLTAITIIAFAVLSTGAKRIQCGVSNAAIIAYLKGAPHYHPYACCVVDIPGSCNSTATIENCGTATQTMKNKIKTITACIALGAMMLWGNFAFGQGSCDLTATVRE